MSDSHRLTPTTRRDGSPTLPARGYSWETFKPGNRVAERHGGFGQQRVSEVAAELHRELLEACPWVTNLDGEAVDRYLRAESRSRLLHAHVLRVTAEKGLDAVKPYLWGEVTKAENNAARFASDLGLDPAGRARLARDFGGGAAGFASGDLKSLAAEGRRLRLAAERRTTDAVGTHGAPNGTAASDLPEAGSDGATGHLGGKP